jgi:hypothetical protein
MIASVAGKVSEDCYKEDLENIRHGITRDLNFIVDAIRGRQGVEITKAVLSVYESSHRIQCKNSYIPRSVDGSYALMRY